MTHQQVTLDLSECVEHNAHQNQQRCSAKELRERILNIQQASQCRHDSDECDEQ